MRYLADLQKSTITSDGGGGNAETFSTIAKIFIDIRPVSGDERDRQGKVQGQTTHKIHTIATTTTVPKKITPPSVDSLR